MIQARAILAQTVTTITADPSATLRVVLVPWLLSLVAYFGVDLAYFGTFAGLADYDPETFDTDALMQPGPPVIWYALSFIATTACWLWIAVGWHRYVLENEAPRGWWPALHLGRTARYLGKAILTLLPTIPLLVLVLLGFSAATPDDIYADLDPELSTSDLLMFFVIGVMVSYIGFRFGPLLPATALDRPMGLVEAWRMTAPMWVTLLQLALIIGIFYAIGDFAANKLSGNDFLYLCAHFIYDLISFLALGILTVLYGLLVEGRQLNVSDE